ncbi:MAG: ABC transporter ATP-binding protein [Solobacterium sp.]|nr:ABC transporter ATP-binding protein [Solobacterium sp.]
MSSLLSIRDLNVSFAAEDKRFLVLNNVSLDLARGEIKAIVGESGCGKTTLANTIMRLLPAGAVIESGTILLNDQDLTKYTEKEMRIVRAEDMGMIFQDPFSALDPVYTILDQFRETLNIRSSHSSAEVREISVNMLRQVGIPEPEKILKKYPYELSGGLRQRVLIAGSLLNEPQLLIADEPTTALDVTVQKEILSLLKDLAVRNGLSVLFITHSLNVAAVIADTIAVFYGGRVVEEAPVKDLFMNPRHPYTRGLLNTIPSLSYGKAERKLTPIPGELFSFTEHAEGCPFAPRCTYAEEECHKEFPALRTVGNHRYACYKETK